VIIRTVDGSYTLYSEQFGVNYRSSYGAVGESIHVFIAAGLRFKSEVQQEISILEMGLGTGLNAFLTMLEAEKRSLAVSYTALEMYPVQQEEIQALHYPALLEAAEEDFQNIHRCDWEKVNVLSETFTLLKHHRSVECYCSPASFDVIYFDAFAPQTQPELWTEDVFQNMYDSLKPGGVLVTYCAQSEFKRRLKRVGFMVERLKGPLGKLEMTRARKDETT
jgi:tRNA U34 5-methylaminomethyl-2-thiouridine-forming methyltransferase MnmC